MKTRDFDYWLDMITEIITVKNIHKQNDQVMLCCGYEGTGKSTFSKATHCGVHQRLERPERNEAIFFTWDEYLKTNVHAIINRLDEIPPALLQKLLREYKLHEEDLSVPKDCYLPEIGDVLVYDESGSQAFNRRAMTKANVNQAILMLCNRFLRLVHIWNIPNPTNTDPYIRYHRAKWFIWVDTEWPKNWRQILRSGGVPEEIRNVYIYGKKAFNKILYSYHYWEYFSSTEKLIDNFKPDLVIKPPVNINDYIPEHMQTSYHSKKMVFNLQQLYTMIKEENPEAKKKVDHLDRMVNTGESVGEWVERTGCSPTQFTSYGGSRRKERKHYER